MARVFVVRVDFSRNGKDYKRGDLIADPVVLADLAGSDHEPHGHMTELPDDHHAVAPFIAPPAPKPTATVPVPPTPPSPPSSSDMPKPASA